MLVVKSELHAAQAEVRILSTLPPPPPPPLLTPPLSPQQPTVEKVVEREVVLKLSEASEVHAPFLCTRCKRTEEASQQEEELAMSEKKLVSLEAAVQGTKPQQITEAPLLASHEGEMEQQQDQPQEQTAPAEAMSVDSPPATVEEDALVEDASGMKENSVEELLVTEDKKLKEIEEAEEEDIPAPVEEESTPPAAQTETEHAVEIHMATHLTTENALPTSPPEFPLKVAAITATVTAPAPAASTTSSTETQTTPANTNTSTSTDATTEPERAPSREVPTAAIAALLSEYGRSSAQVQLLAQDLVYYKQLAEDALRAKAEETLASREAATVAVHACMRRADCEQELEESIYQLRELQRKHSRLTIEYDAEVRRNYALKARLQLYAQKLSAMEVDYTLSLEETADL